MRATVVGLLALGVAGCERPNYTLFYYPNGISGGAVMSSGYSSLEMCRLAATEAKAALGRLTATDATPDYECGNSCRVQPGMTIATCATTER